MGLLPPGAGEAEDKHSGWGGVQGREPLGLASAGREERQNAHVNIGRVRLVWLFRFLIKACKSQAGARLGGLSSGSPRSLASVCPINACDMKARRGLGVRGHRVLSTCLA